GVEVLGPLYLGVEVAIFTGTVGVFVVDEEEVVLRPVFFEHGHLLGERLGFADDVHADEPREAFVHRVDGNRRGTEAVDFFVARQVGLAGDAAESEPVGFWLPFENGARLLDEFGGDLGRLFAVFVGRLGGKRRHAGALRVGVVHVATEAFAAE